MLKVPDAPNVSANISRCGVPRAKNDEPSDDEPPDDERPAHGGALRGKTDEERGGGRSIQRGRQWKMRSTPHVIAKPPNMSQA
ncbi:hypothetical protein JCM10599A_34540 [Paraburkholderia kururiensis]